ncbi:MAG: DUF3785 domain-containing protein [Tepidibacter sp.]|jgi:hypothetical protein|uniref:DUF3785 family protein n=1 Tax=Tepidibacter sp. TaxID=2529387 RepID=UPI0025D407AB|nr:DUF3785 family protein [Tepidibacter sp.]MCT4509250.1 DUF3785 domain-containing protein [Tepidibacter sp.]
MVEYTFEFNENLYDINISNCMDEESSEVNFLIGLTNKKIINLLKQQKNIDFDIAYYDQACQNCLNGVSEKAKYFKFLEYYFYVFAKNDKYVMSNISEEYENTSFKKMLKKGIVDSSYIISIIVCIECGKYSIEIEDCDS